MKKNIHTRVRDDCISDDMCAGIETNTLYNIENDLLAIVILPGEMIGGGGGAGTR